MAIDVTEVHSENAPFSINVTESWIVIDFRLTHRLNARGKMLVSVPARFEWIAVDDLGFSSVQQHPTFENKVCVL